MITETSDFRGVCLDLGNAREPRLGEVVGACASDNGEDEFAKERFINKEIILYFM